LPVRDIYTQSRVGLSDAEIMQMPSYSATQRLVDRNREIPGRSDIDAVEIANIVIQVCVFIFSIFYQF